MRHVNPKCSDTQELHKRPQNSIDKHWIEPFNDKKYRFLLACSKQQCPSKCFLKIYTWNLLLLKSTSKTNHFKVTDTKVCFSQKAVMVINTVLSWISLTQLRPYTWKARTGLTFQTIGLHFVKQTKLQLIYSFDTGTGAHLQKLPRPGGTDNNVASISHPSDPCRLQWHYTIPFDMMPPPPAQIPVSIAITYIYFLNTYQLMTVSALSHSPTPVHHGAVVLKTTWKLSLVLPSLPFESRLSSYLSRHILLPQNIQ